MTKHYGRQTEENDGRRLELRILDDSQQKVLAVLHRSLVKDLKIDHSVLTIGHFTAVIATSENDREVMRHLRYKVPVEIRATTPTTPETIMLRAIIDYVEVKTGDNVDSSLGKDIAAHATLEGRSAVSMCVDEGLWKTGKASLSTIIADLASNAPSNEIDLLEDRPVEVYLDVHSCYAAMRLLAISYEGCTEVTNEGKIIFRDKGAARRKDRDRTIHTISEKDIRGLTRREGRRIRRA